MSSSAARLGPRLLSAPLPRELPAPLREVAAALRPVVRSLLAGYPPTDSDVVVDPGVDGCKPESEGSAKLVARRGGIATSRPSGFVAEDVCLDIGCDICEVGRPRADKFDRDDFAVPVPVIGTSRGCVLSIGDVLLRAVRVLDASRLEDIGMLEGTVTVGESAWYVRPTVRLEGATRGLVLAALTVAVGLLGLIPAAVGR
mmetsp:Transcript_90550/g.170676  ORF Transcript_90550/g.170676 Transcript_90550/m.170676 type:complete len:200 (-) Transcript_90550:125-724(-)